MDLNLLTALDALLEERSVGAAASRLRLSQPAMSRTLGRIRQATGDPILVRSGRSMLLTPYAEQIQDEVHQLVTRGQSVLTPVGHPDLARLRRTFTVQFNDVITGALLPQLVTRVAAAAPGVLLRVLGESDASAGGLRTGQVDLQVSDQAPAHADVRSVVVTTDRLATFGRRELPDDPATLAGFAALPHVIISRRGRQRDRLDDLLNRHGLRRRVVLTVPTLRAALLAVTAAGLITVAPAAMAAGQLGPDLRAYDLPLAVDGIPAVMAWHARHDRDHAHRWLRDLVAEILSHPGSAAPERRARPAGEPDRGR
jgi:DNA-binding transcriptional LysR family regulator